MSRSSLHGSSSLRGDATRLLAELEEDGCIASATGPLSGTAAGSIGSPLVLLVVVAVDVGAEVVAIVAILGNVLVVGLTSCW